MGFHTHTRFCDCEPQACETCGALVCTTYQDEHDELHDGIRALGATLDRAETAAIRRAR